MHCLIISSIICVLVIGFVNSIMLKKECPSDEIHRSCSFYDEYTCWSGIDRMYRVKLVPPKLAHCKSGCFCRKGFVRDYPRGMCIVAAGCKDYNLKTLQEDPPEQFITGNIDNEYSL